MISIFRSVVAFPLAVCEGGKGGRVERGKGQTGKGWEVVGVWGVGVGVGW